METASDYETQPQEDELVDESNDHAYFAMLPNMLDDMLDPYQYRLYAHIKRVCGESKDSRCWQSVRTMAEKCRMSVGKVTEVKQELRAMGLISVTEHKRPNGGLPYHRIAILDIWARNLAHCQKASSSSEGPSSSGEQASSQGEPKKIPQKEESEDTATPSVPDSPQPPPAQEPPHRQEQEPEQAKEAPPSTLNDWLERLKKPDCNRVALLRWMLTIHFPDCDVPSFGKVGKVAKRLHAGRLCEFIWVNSGRRITGCPLDYIQALAKGKNNGNGGESTGWTAYVELMQERHGEDWAVGFSS